MIGQSLQNFKNLPMGIVLQLVGNVIGGVMILLGFKTMFSSIIVGFLMSIAGTLLISVVQKILRKILRIKTIFLVIVSAILYLISIFVLNMIKVN